MGNFSKEFKRHVHIYGIFIKNCLIKQMEYRANFFMMIAIETMYLMVKILYAVVLYRTGVTIYGISPNGILLFIGTYVVEVGFFMSLFYFNFSALQQSVNDGTLDIYITKPISLQFMSTLRNVDFGTCLPNIVGGLIIVFVGWQKSTITVNFTNVLMYIVLLICGVLTGYSVMLFPNLLCFWIVKASSIQEITNSMLDFNNMPMTIYTKWMQRIGVFVFPIFLMSNYSSLFLLHRLNIGNILWGIVAPIIFFILVRLFWKFCIRNYSSASS